MITPALRVLTLSQLREQPLRVLASVLAIALGVALGAAVYLLNTAALADFTQAARRLVGDADVVVRGPSSGFDEALFVRLSRDPAVAMASPIIELNASVLPGTRPALKIIAMDAFRASLLQPGLVAALSRDITGLFAHDAIVLSQGAAQQYGTGRGRVLEIESDGVITPLRVIDVLPADACPAVVGIMDIGAAQWTLKRIGVIDRIDVRLRPGIAADAWRARVAATLPAGVIAESPEIERGRAATATRAYRVNLTVLALVALLTGGFVVFAVQWLSVLRRRVALGLLRALGVTRGELRRALLAEAVVVGLLGSVLGALLGVLLTGAALHLYGSDLGNGQLADLQASLQLRLLPLAGFVLLGTLASAAGGALPAWLAARRAPALALKAGDEEEDQQHLRTALPGVGLAAIGGLLACLPPIGGLPLAGYLAIACLLFGAVLLAPSASQWLIGLLPRTGLAVPDTSLSQLRGTLASSTISLASILVSFSLMVAMAIMVHSFRESFDRWLILLLPAELQLRAAPGSETAELTPEMQQRLAAVPGVARLEGRRLQPLYLRAGRAPLTLIARTLTTDRVADTLPLLAESSHPAPPGMPPAWVSEAVQDLYDIAPGSILDLPLNGRSHAFFVAGVWRDYVRSTGAVVIRRADYEALTGDRAATEASIWTDERTDPAALSARIRDVLGGASAFELISSPELRERSLAAFDRAFAITYALEAVAVLLGLFGVAVAAGSTALARRAQFGVLRHLGMLRRQVMWMFATEGITLSSIAALYGLLVGALLSLILIYVVNRQSFHWSIDLHMPWAQLLALSVVLIACAAGTALWSGRSALGIDPIRAVREDW